MGDILRVLGTLVIVVFMTAYLGSQFVAVGQAMATDIGLGYEAAVVIGGLVIAAYTTLGGFNASVWSDYLQGWLMLFAAIAFPIAAIWSVGGWSPFIEQVQGVNPTLLTWHGGNSGSGLILFVAGWLAFSLSITGQPHALQRFQAIKSEQIISPATVIATSFSALRMSLPILIGISGHVLFDSVGNPERIMAEGIVTLFPSWLAGLLLAGIVSAILSTADSMLILTSSDLTRNIYERYVNPDASDRRLIYVGRLFVVGFSLLAIMIAWIQPGTIFDILMFGFIGLGACLGSVLLLVLFWDGLTGWGAAAGMATGIVVTVLNRLYVIPDTFPILVWPVTVAVIVGVSLVTKPDHVARPTVMTTND